MQTFYPEFESGQVLTNAHLNQLGTWLNEQQQATRHKLLGIGIVCGLEATVEASRITVGRGVAITSAGHLICREQAHSHGRFRSYTLPVSGTLDDAFDAFGSAAPELLPLPDIELWELLTDDAAPRPGEPVPGTLTEAFLADKVVMLLLETRRESLKNCDVNDCSDKGARWVHTVRTLLLKEPDAKALWQTETADSADLLPRDLAWQELRGKLAPGTMNKLPLAATGAGSLQEIRSLAAAQVASGWQQLQHNLQISFDVYGYLLRERFPAEAFPLDPWHALNPVLPAEPQSLANLLVDLHRYDMLQDALASYHEFLEASCEFEALCCPDPQRFPFHVLLGRPESRQAVEQPGNRSFEQVDFNLGARPDLPYLRHPFYPALPLGRQQRLAAGMLDLYYRTWLIFQRYRSDRLLESPLRIIPSRKQGPLSRKAIPYYFALARNDDLHRNWNPHATRCGMLSQVHGHGVSDDKVHPLTQAPDDSDFYRVEGLLGRPLGQVLTALKAQQRRLGIGFGIEPVFVPVLKIDSDKTRAALLALLQREQTLQRLFKCKLGDIDFIFLLLLGFIFQLLVALIYLVSRTGRITSVQGTAGFAGTVAARATINPAILAVNAGEVTTALNSDNQAGMTMALQSSMSSNTLATFLQNQVRVGSLRGADVIDALDEPDDRNGVNAAIYKQVNAQTRGDLFQRVRSVLGANASEPQLQQTYHSMRMFQQAETLLEQASVTSIAQFDFDRFETGLGELQTAYQGYLAQLPPLAGATRPTAEAALERNMNTLGNVGGSALLTNIKSEFATRIGRIFSEFMFDGYNQRFPGLEHLCGVPKGGTLVLAYTHKSLLQQPPTVGLTVLDTRFTAILAEAGASAPTISVDAPASGGNATDVQPTTIESVTNREALVAAQQATALRIQHEARLAEREAAAQETERQVVLATRSVDTSRKELAKLVTRRERLNVATTASAADKRTATIAVKQAETVVATEAEKLTLAQANATRERARVTAASKAVSEARQAEEQALAAAAATSVRPETSTGLSGSAVVVDTPRLAATALSERNFAALLADDDPLNNLIVVADFCLPTYCCDSDCADLVPTAPPDTPVPDKPATAISVSGRIVSGDRGLTRIAATQVLHDAALSVVDRNNQAVPVKLTRGSFLFKVNPGTYLLVASAPGHQASKESITIDAPLGQELVIVLQRG